MYRYPHNERLQVPLDSLQSHLRPPISFPVQSKSKLERVTNINLAVGGGYTGITGIDNIDKITALNENNGYEAKMYIDYVKIYQNDIDGGTITIK